MVSRENKIIGGFVVAALVLGFGSTAVADVPSVVPLAIFLIVGVIMPMIVTNYRDLSGAV